MIRLKGGSGPVMRAAQRSDFPGISLRHEIVNIYVSGESSSVVADKDAVFFRYIAPTYYMGGTLILEGTAFYEIKNLNPEVASIAEDGTITRVSAGIARIMLRTPKITLETTLNLNNKSDGQSVDTYSAVVSGSLAADCRQQIDSRIDNTMTMAVNGRFFTTQDHAAQNYVRNPYLWCADVDLTCISPWNSNSGVFKSGTLITPRHVLNAAHYEYNVGNTVRFVAMDGTVHNRTIIGKKRHPDYQPYFPDLTIYTLDSDLPSTITPCKLMPSDWNAYLVHNFQTRPPALGLDQEEKALIIDFHTSGSFMTPTDENRLIFHESKISGDSGNPAFLIVNGELVLITVWTYGGAGSGTPVAHFIDDLNSMILLANAQAGVTGPVADASWPNANGHYRVKPADFSGFPNYASS